LYLEIDSLPLANKNAYMIPLNPKNIMRVMYVLIADIDS